MTTAKDDKQAFRERMLALLRSQSEADRVQKSELISQKLLTMQEFKESKTILFYASFDGEVQTYEMMKLAQKLGKIVSLPRLIRATKQFVPALISSLTNDLVSGPYGIKEPKAEREVVDINQIDLVIVPGVAFDKRLHRLGRGQGYYDRFLDVLPRTIPTVGLAYHFQIVDHLPFQEKHDVALTHVLSN